MITSAKRFLTSGDVCELADIAQSTLDRWIKSGHLKPANNSRGTGVHRRFSIMEATAVAFGKQLRERKCSIEWTGQVVQFVANMSEADLIAAMGRGETFLLPVPSDLCLTKPPIRSGMTNNQREMIRQFDLGETYLEVQRRIVANEDTLPVPGADTFETPTKFL